MAEIAFLEVLDRGGEVVARHAVHGFPLTIGRAYDNDVILDEAYVAAHHVRIEASEVGYPVAHDLDSKNGLIALPIKGKRLLVELAPHTVLRVGHTQLRLRARDFAVPPERVEGRGTLLTSPVTLGALVLLLVGLTAADLYLSTVEPTEWVNYLAPLAGVVLLLFLWIGFWALMSRLLLGRPNALRHANIACLGLAGLSIWQALASWGAFAFSVPLHVYALLGAGVLAALTLYAHAKLVNPRHTWIPAVSSVAVVAAVLAVSLAQQLGVGDEVDDQHAVDLKIPAARLTGARALEPFLESAQSMKARVDALRGDPD